MERLQREFPEARFVKAFNSVGSAFMVDPKFKGGKPTMFICGNDDAARKTVTGILEQFGWETSDMGKAEAARAIEPLCILWCIPGFLRNDWTHAFKVVSQSGP
jgi:predicted dinucleotide-binding enzyme